MLPSKLKQKKIELIRYLEQLRDYKAKTIKFVEDLELKYSKGEILDSEFYYKLNKALKNKSLETWVNYYDNLISQYNKELIKINNELKENENILFSSKTVLIILIFLMLSITSIILFKPEITGLTIYQQGEIINDTLTLSINKNITINESVVLVELNSQEKQIPLTDFKIIENLVTIELSKFNLIAEDGTLTARIVYNNSVISETSLLIELQQIEPAQEIDNSSIKFDRNLDCNGCGQHKAPPDAAVNMIIKVTFNGVTKNNVLIDYYPVSWNIIDVNGGVISNHDSNWNKITWNLNNNDGYVEKSYLIQAPRVTTPPTKYDFKSEFIIESKLWDIIVADPACTFTVTLELPTVNPNINQYENFTAQAKIVCGGGGSRSSNNVDLRIRYNATTTAADTLVPTGLNAQLKANESSFNCGTLTNSAGSDTCIHNWNITGIQLGGVFIDASQGASGTNSADELITINPPPQPNVAPTITIPAFNQTSYNDNHKINVSLVVMDENNDLTNVTFEWYKNQILLERRDYYDIANGTNISDVLPRYLLVGDDQIEVQAFAFDGELNSTLLNSSIITIIKTETFDNTTIPTTPSFDGWPEKSISEIINETGITTSIEDIASITELSYSAKEITLNDNKKVLFIHQPIVNGTLLNNTFSLIESDNFTYNSSFEDDRILIEIENKVFQRNLTRWNLTSSKGNNIYGWKIGYNYKLPSQNFKEKFRISSNNPIQILDSDFGKIKAGKHILDFTTEVNNGYSIEINQTHSNIIFLYLNKNYSEEGLNFDDEIEIDPTLTIDGSTYELCGEVDQYDKIEIANNGVATICTKNATSMTGYANISLGSNGNFSLSADSRIEGKEGGARGGAGSSSATACSTQGENGNNFTLGTTSCLSNGGGGSGANRAGTGDSIGGGGGAFGGGGGKGGYSAADVQSVGGNIYGSATGLTLFAGSGGGGESGDTTAGTGPGGKGGSGLKINASAGWITIYGIINMSGNNGTNGDATDDSGAGGGSGGHIILSARNLSLGSATKIFADGGRGGNAAGTSTSDSCGGGGGGGGRILYHYETAIISNTFYNSTWAGLDGVGTDGACDQTTDAGTSTDGANGTIAHLKETFPEPPSNIAPNNPTNLVINSTTTEQLNKTTEDLRMNFLCDDPDDADTLTFHLTAFKNYVNQFQLQSSCNDPEYKSVILDYKNTTKFDNWSFSINVSDVGGLYSNTVSSVVNLTIRNSLPIIGNVTLDMSDSISIVENGNRSFLFSFVVTDPDNTTDINNFSAVANITRGFGSTAEATRYNDTFVNVNDGGCKAVNNIATNGKNFSCTINIVFYDEAGLWNISVRINDTNEFAQNTTKTFSIQETSSIQIFSSSISFPQVTPNQNNITALVNLTIRNIGNDDISGREATGETINITAITLVGVDDASKFIPVSNFTIGQVNASGTFKGDFCDYSIVNNVTRLQNTSVAQGYANFTGAINGSSLQANANNNVHTIGICLIHVPGDLTGQDYSTTKSGAWTITIFFFKKKKNKVYEKNKIIIDKIIRLKIDYKLKDDDFKKLINYEKELVLVPISIFKNNSPLESLVKYLKDNLNLSLSEIASLLNRDQRTIWITYNNAVKNIKGLDTSSKIIISINIFSNRKLSILENLVDYLYDKNISLNKISKLLNRNYKTIYTVHKRCLKKLNKQ